MADIVDNAVIEILLVEDNPGDVRLTAEALEEAKVSHHLNTVRDGIEAMDFLFHRGRYRGASLPDLILLDLNLPRKSGRDVMAEIKGDAALSNIPLIVLTSSAQDQDVLDGCNPIRCRYRIKPLSFNTLVDIFKEIKGFMLTAVAA